MLKNGLKIESVKKLVVSIVAVIVTILVIVFCVLIVRYGLRGKRVVKAVDKEEIVKELNIDILDPVDADDVKYGIENNTIARVTYRKKALNDEYMTFVMRSAYSLEEVMDDMGANFKGSTLIKMNVICQDKSEIGVEAKVALDRKGNMNYMRAVWFDNDKYYSMVTDDLVTREDFLQEVNRVIIANHITF